MTPGEFRLNEVATQDGYEKATDNSPTYIVPERGALSKTNETKIIDFIEFNDEEKGSIELTKIDSEGNDKFLDGVEFELEVTELFNVPSEKKAQ